MDHELLILAAGYVGGRGTAFLDELIKPSAKAAGEALFDHYKQWRARNLAAVVEEATQIVGESERPPTAVPGRLLFSILESASYEDDDFLRSRWAALLANSVAGDRMFPGFVEILKQLTPMHVEILTLLESKYAVRDYDDSFTNGMMDDKIRETLPTGPLDWDLFATDLHRLQLVEGQTTARQDPRHADRTGYAPFA